MDKSVRETDASDNINLDLDLTTNGQFGAPRKPKPHSSTAVNLNAPTQPPITPKVELEGVSSAAERAPPISHLPPHNASPTSHESKEAARTTREAVRVATKQMNVQLPPRTNLLTTSSRSVIPPPPPAHSGLQMEGGRNNDDNAASSQAPVLRQQAPAAVDAMNARQLSAGAVNVESGRRTKMPRVYARGRGAGNNGETTTVHGFLYRFDTVEALSIICVCHGLCHTPAQFVEHAGGGAAEQEHPLRHIVVVDAADYFAHQTSSSPSSSFHRPL